MPVNKQPAQILKHFSQKDYDFIGLIDLQSKHYLLYAVMLDSFAVHREGNYDDYLYHLAKSIQAETERSIFLKEMSVEQITDHLQHKEQTRFVYYPTHRPSGEPVYYKIKFRYFNEKKKQITIAFHDATSEFLARIETNQKLQRAGERFQFLIQNMCDSFWEVNIETGESWSINPKNNMVSKSTLKEQITWFAQNMIIREEQAAFMQEFELTNLIDKLRHNDGFYTANYTTSHEDSKHYLLIVNKLMKDSSDNNSEYIFSYTQDITVLKQQEEKNKQLLNISQQLLDISQNDTLTGLFNRDAAEKAICEHLTHDQTGEPGTLLLIDIDYFKSFNDNFGHLIGDYILKFLAKSMKDAFRSDDILCRWGGDEFLIFLRDISDEAIVHSRIQRLRLKMQQCKNAQGHDLPVTLSIGGIIGKNGATLDSLFQKADEMLYRVKKQGRNNFIVTPS